MATRKKRGEAAATSGRSRSRTEGIPKAKSGRDNEAVLLRFMDLPPIELDIPKSLSPEELSGHAREWNYRLRDRRRWATRETGVNELQATRPRRGESPFTVVRRLRSARASRATRPRKWLMAQSAPGVLHEGYDFSSERDILERSAGASGATLDRIENPSTEALKTKILSQPSFKVVHLAGLDVHQGMEYMQSKEALLQWTALLQRSEHSRYTPPERLPPLYPIRGAHPQA